MKTYYDEELFEVLVERSESCPERPLAIVRA